MWPAHIIEPFEITNPKTRTESHWYGPYNVLLGYLFPPTERYVIHPQHSPPLAAGSIDFTTLFIVEQKMKHVLFIEIKPNHHLKHPHTRASADEQMRSRFFKLGHGLVIPKLYGISAMGTQIAIYHCDRPDVGPVSSSSAEDGEVQYRVNVRPPAIKDPGEDMIDRAPKSRWTDDIMTPRGEAMLRRLAQEIKAMCNNIHHVVDDSSSSDKGDNNGQIYSSDESTDG